MYYSPNGETERKISMVNRKKTLKDLVDRLTQCPPDWHYRLALTKHTPVVGKELVIHVPTYKENSYTFKNAGVVREVHAVWLAGGWHFFVSTENDDLYIVQRSGFTHRASNRNTFIGAISCNVVAPNANYPAESPVYAFSHNEDTIYTAQFSNVTILETVFIPNTNLMVVQVRMNKLERIINVICTIC